MNVLLSIKPRFARKILCGEKRYEFRKSSFTRSDQVDKIVMYASSPEQKIVGQFEINDIIKESPEVLWRRCKTASGIEDKQEFMQYYEGYDKGVAIEVKNAEEFKPALEPKDLFEGFTAPMSFCYINKRIGAR